MSKNINIYICGCVKNADKYLHNVFKNIQNICHAINNYYIIIAYDESDDNSLATLQGYLDKHKEKMVILENKQSLSNVRTKNIANARNTILNKIKELHLGFEYFIMMDMDDVCSGSMNMSVLNYILNKEKTQPLPWDCISFNRAKYYDIWALSIYPYTFSFLHYKSFNTTRKKMHDYIKNSLRKCYEKNGNDGLIRCISAFNGFAIYRTESFINSTYEWNVNKLLEIYSRNIIDAMSRVCVSQPIDRIDDCEHRYFHIHAAKQNGARICISPMYLFS